MRPSPSLLTLVALTLAAVAPRAARAQAPQQTITACSASRSGSMYRVGVAGAPADCTNANHRRESWGVQGPAGPQGAPGAPGIAGLHIEKSIVGFMPGTMTLDTVCPAGKRVIGGGFSTAAENFTIQQSMPADPDVDGVVDAWRIRLRNPSASAVVVVEIYAVCATVAP